MAKPAPRLPKWLDRAGFEADKMIRVNRVRTEAARIKDQADDKTFELGVQALELAAAGTELDPSLSKLVEEVKALQAEVARKEREVQAIEGEVWTEQGPINTGGSGQEFDPIAQRLQSYVESKTRNFNCPKCNAVIRSNAQFCPRCGRRVLR